VVRAVDNGIVLEGRVVLVLDSEETTLRAGDVAVQPGTSHRWENRTERTARMAFILIDGAFTADLLATLGDAAPPMTALPTTGSCMAWSTTRACPTGRECSTCTWPAGTG
jgi:hypothetical protein